MQPSIVSVLDSIHAEVDSRIEAEVFLGAPDDTSPGVYIVPIQYIESHTHHIVSSNRSDDRSAPGYTITCMMVACPANNYAAIDSGIKYLHDHPVLEAGNETIRLTPSFPSLDELTQIFVSAGISLRLSVMFEVRVIRKE